MRKHFAALSRFVDNVAGGGEFAVVLKRKFTMSSEQEIFSDNAKGKGKTSFIEVIKLMDFL